MCKFTNDKKIQKIIPMQRQFIQILIKDFNIQLHKLNHAMTFYHKPYFSQNTMLQNAIKILISGKNEEDIR